MKNCKASDIVSFGSYKLSFKLDEVSREFVVWHFNRSSVSSQVL